MQADARDVEMREAERLADEEAYILELRRSEEEEERARDEEEAQQVVDTNLSWTSRRSRWLGCWARESHV